MFYDIKPVKACSCYIGAPFQEGISPGLIKLALRQSVNVPLMQGNVIHYLEVQEVIPGFQDWLILYQLFTNANSRMASSHETVSLADTPSMKREKSTSSCMKCAI